MAATTCNIDPSTISPALERARAISTERILLGSGSLADRSMLESLATCTADLPTKTLIQALLDASTALKEHTAERYREATTSSQALALGFISEQTGQSLPGMLTLPGRHFGVTFQVEGVDAFYCNGRKWSATLRIQARPRCHTTRRVYTDDSGLARWEEELDC